MDNFRGQYLLISILIIVGTLFLFLTFYQLSFHNLQNAGPGVFGDFMGGVVGTIFTAIASVFVYNTYKTQKQQLNVQHQEFELQKKEANQRLVDSLYDRISKEIDDIEITFDRNTSGQSNPVHIELITYKGIFALYNFKDLYQKDNTVLNQLCLTLISFEHLFILTKESKYKWKRQLQVNQDRNYLMFYTKLIWPIHQFYLYKWDMLITEWNPPHPDAKSTRERFEKLLKETFKYLLNRKLVGIPVDEAYKKIINS